MLHETGFRGKQQFVNYLGTARGLKTGGEIIVKNPNKILQLLGSLGEAFIGSFGGTEFGETLISFLAAIGTFMFGKLGLKVEHPVAVGIGLLIFIIGLVLVVAVLYVAYLISPWLLLLIICLILVGLMLFSGS